VEGVWGGTVVSVGLGGGVVLETSFVRRGTLVGWVGGFVVSTPSGAGSHCVRVGVVVPSFELLALLRLF